MRFYDIYAKIMDYLEKYFIIHSLTGVSLLWATFLVLSVIGAIRITVGMARTHRGELMLQKDRVEMGTITLPEEEPQEEYIQLSIEDIVSIQPSTTQLVIPVPTTRKTSVVAAASFRPPVPVIFSHSEFDEDNRAALSYNTEGRIYNSCYYRRNTNP